MFENSSGGLSVVWALLLFSIFFVSALILRQTIFHNPLNADKFNMKDLGEPREPCVVGIGPVVNVLALCLSLSWSGPHRVFLTECLLILFPFYFILYSSDVRAFCWVYPFGFSSELADSKQPPPLSVCLSLQLQFSGAYLPSTMLMQV